MSPIRPALRLAALATALSLSACSPVGLGLTAASLALDAFSGGESEPLSPGESLNRSLAGLDDSVSRACLDALPPDAPQRSGEPADGARGPDREPPADGVRAGATEPSHPDGGACRVAPVCLPGKSVPAEMMMCAVDDGEERPQTAARGARLPRQGDWQWRRRDGRGDATAPARVNGPRVSEVVPDRRASPAP